MECRGRGVGGSGLGLKSPWGAVQIGESENPPMRCVLGVPSPLSLLSPCSLTSNGPCTCAPHPRVLYHPRKKKKGERERASEREEDDDRFAPRSRCSYSRSWRPRQNPIKKYKTHKTHKILTRGHWTAKGHLALQDRLTELRFRVRVPPPNVIIWSTGPTHRAGLSTSGRLPPQFPSSSSLQFSSPHWT